MDPANPPHPCSDNFISSPQDSKEYPNFLTPLAQGREISDRGGRGVYAVSFIEAGTVVAVFGGRLIGIDKVLALDPPERSRVLQVATRWFLYSIQDYPCDWINHSCDPNCGFQDEITLVAMRDIQPGEEVSFDYAMADSVSYDEFPCECGAHSCRGVVLATDWQLSRLQDQYGSHFSPYLLESISLRSERSLGQPQVEWAHIG